MTHSETFVFGHVATHPDAFGTALTLGLDAEHFRSPVLAEAWGVALGLFQRGVLTSHQVLEGELKERGVFDRIGSEGWTRLLATGWNEEDLPYHVDRIRRSWALSERREALREAIEILESDDSLTLAEREAAVERATTRLLELSADDGDTIMRSEDMALDFERDVDSETPSVVYEPTGFCSLDKVIGGLPVSRVTTVAAFTSQGKAQPLDAPVLSPDGWVTMGDLEVGSLVIGSDGKPTRVTHVFPQGVKDVYRVTLNDGSEAECCDEHLWFTYSYADRVRGRRGSVRTTKQVRESLVVGRKQPRLNHRLHHIAPVEFSAKRLPIDPYILGVLLGDGSLSNGGVRFSCGDAFVAEEVGRRLPEALEVSCCAGVSWGIVQRGVTRNEMLDALRALGLDGTRSHEKFVPDEYLLGSVAQRLDLLRGLMDTDGSPHRDWGGVDYFTTSPHLKDAVVEIVRSLGGKVSVGDRQGRYKKNGVYHEARRGFRLSLQFSSGINPFLLPRKAEVFSAPNRPCLRAIASIEKSRRAECRCIRVEAQDNIYITSDYIPTHNSSYADQLMLQMARRWRNTGENKQAVKFSPEVPNQDTRLRVFANLSEIDARAIEDHLQHTERLGDASLQRVKEAASELRTLPVVWDDRSAPTNAYVIARLLAEDARCPVGLAVFDYLEMSGEEHDQKRIRMERAMIGAHNAARLLGIPFVMVAQINRTGQGRLDGVPHLVDLAETSMIEKVSSLVLMLQHPHTWWNQTGRTAEEPPPLAFNLYVRKNTRGPLGRIDTIRWRKENLRFYDSLDPEAVASRAVGRAHDPSEPRRLEQPPETDAPF